jgi:uncharacterized protein YndB with AHSA1/START domain
MTQSTDRIERKILLKAPRARVWRALSNAEEFGGWFGVKLKGQSFAPGQRTRGQVMHPGYEHLTFEVLIERMEPERMLSWRWHPGALQEDADFAAAPTTVVTFKLEDAEGGTLVSVVESGFDSLPPHRRMDAFRENTEGWDAQMKAIEKHVATS